MKNCVFAAAAMLAIAGGASAQTVNGNITGDGYGAPYAVQTTQTQFGNNASELNAAYGSISGGRLYVAFTGNVEANFNKLEIFLDSKSGGQSVFSSAGNDGAGAMNGMTFPTGFTADYHIIVRRGGSQFDVDIASLNTGGGGSFTMYGNIFAGANFGSASTGTGVNTQPLQFGYDGSNTAGISDGTGAADPVAAALVSTGLEFSIDLADLGLPSSVNVLAFQNNQNHNYASNQFLPGLATPQGNLGGDGIGGFNGTFALNLNNFGIGYFTIPAPSSVALVGLAGLLASRRRR